MMPAIIENALVYLAEVPATYLLALLGLNLLLLILLIARRKKKKGSVANKQASVTTQELESEEDAKLLEPSLLDKGPDQPDQLEGTHPDLTVSIDPNKDAPFSEKISVSEMKPEESPKPQDEPVVAQRDEQKVDLKPHSETSEVPIIKRPAPDDQPHIDKPLPDVSVEPVADVLDKPPLLDPPLPAEKAVEKPVRLFTRLKNGLSKTRQFLNTDIDQFFDGRKKIDDELLEDLEELLITADIGVQTAMDLIERISKLSIDITNADQLKNTLKNEIQLLLKTDAQSDPGFSITESRPHVIMVVGVNGVGKTTTIGKLAAHYKDANKKVLIAAADTFRAAAVEQVKIWAKRSQADLVCHKDGSDPAAVAFDGVEAGIARGSDVVIIDTAGRLHTKTNLMEELKKIKRSVNKRLEGAPHEILLVLDATTGQNAVSQAAIFHEALDLNGIALTKLDGTAKGGIVVSIAKSLNVPLKYIGVGEHINDLQKFNPQKFVDALF